MNDRRGEAWELIGRKGSIFYLIVRLEPRDTPTVRWDALILCDDELDDEGLEQIPEFVLSEADKGAYSAWVKVS